MPDLGRRVIGELRQLLPAYGQDLETRRRCQDDQHPVGAVHPYWFAGLPGSFCHCGHVIYHGVQPIDRWPRPAARTIRRGTHV